MSGIEEGSARALATVRQVMPARLRHRVDALQVTALDRTAGRPVPTVDTEVLIALGAAVRAREVLRFDYEAASAAPRRTAPSRAGRPRGGWSRTTW